MHSLRNAGSELVNRSGMQHNDHRGDYSQGAKIDELHLTPWG